MVSIPRFPYLASRTATTSPDIVARTPSTKANALSARKAAGTLSSARPKESASLKSKVASSPGLPLNTSSFGAADPNLIHTANLVAPRSTTSRQRLPRHCSRIERNSVLGHSMFASFLKVCSGPREAAFWAKQLGFPVPKRYEFSDGVASVMRAYGREL
jgi:hypothetical protein